MVIRAPLLLFIASYRNKLAYPAELRAKGPYAVDARGSKPQMIKNMPFKARASLGCFYRYYNNQPDNICVLLDSRQSAVYSGL